jgi:3-methyladenine DNA glycosylase AlkD
VTPTQTARDARRQLQALARPAGEFDASRYFRGNHRLVFLNVGTPRVRACARAIRQAHADWTVDDAMAFADALMRHPELEVKGLAVEVVAGYRRAFRPGLLAAWRRWLVEHRASNWATTDSICGSLIGPLLVAFPPLALRLRSWSRHRNLWVRRAAAVSLIPSVRRGLQLDLAYAIAAELHPDGEDLIHKAVGWLLREAGKTDATRLERYLRAAGTSVPRTTVRYAIERFPPARRQALLRATRPPRGG